VRLFRRREGEEPDDRRSPQEEEANDAAWEQLLEDAVAELNASFREDGVPFTCVLEEDEQGLSLSILRDGDGTPPREVEEAVLAPAELPSWLARLRLRLGLLVDETA
jgi:hypothetical protein